MMAVDSPERPQRPLASRLGPHAAEVEALIARCSAAIDDARQRITAASADPWSDPAFADRTLDRVVALLGEDIDALRPAEAALLSAAPWVAEAAHQRAFARLAETHPPGTRSPLHDELERARSGHPALLRRIERAETPADRRAIEAWLEWRAVMASTALWSRGPDGPARDLLADTRIDGTGDALWSLARMIGAGRERLDALDETSGKARLRPLGALLALASAAALDPRRLDTVPVDHLVADVRFSLDGLRAAIAGARWHPRGRGWALHQRCRHPVEQYALEQLAARAQTLADDLRPAGETPALLAGRPSALDTSGVEPATEGAAPIYHPTLVRFRLDHDRIRELLMGERLYGDPMLAIRELYQNALDACRYRRARDAWLRWTRPAEHAEPYRGAIELRQARDARGRLYIECTDDGIGLTRMALERVFAVAGRRFHDLPSFREERARWQARLDTHDAPAEIREALSFRPNSQHGIGVLSYFMLADDLEVTTRAHGIDGAPGEALRVSICSASGLFCVEPAPADTPVGTTVRLYLIGETCDDGKGRSKQISVVDGLLDVLVIAEVSVRAIDVDRADEARWVAGEVLQRVLERWAQQQVTASRDEYATRLRPIAAGLYLGDRPRTPVLVDGIITDEITPWVAPDLRGDRRPRLSADRRRLLGWHASQLDRPLHDALDRLAGDEGLTFAAIWGIVERWPTLGPPLHARLLDRRLPLPFSADATAAPYAAVGFCPTDWKLLDAGYSAPPWSASQATRLDVLCRALHQPPVITASLALAPDCLPPPLGALLADCEWLEDRPDFGPQFALGGTSDHDRAERDAFARRLGLPPRRLAEWDALHAVTAAPSSDGPSELERLCSAALDAFSPGLYGEVPRAHAVWAARRLRLPLDRVDAAFTDRARRSLIEWGGLGARTHTVTDDDLRLLSAAGDGQAPWLPSAITRAELIGIAARHDRSLRAIADRLAQLAAPLGLTLAWTAAELDAAAADPAIAHALKHDRHIVRLATRGEMSWEGAIDAIERLRLPPMDAARHVAAVTDAIGLVRRWSPEGLVAAGTFDRPTRLRLLLSDDGDGMSPFHTVWGAGQIFTAASRPDQTLVDVIEQLRALAGPLGLDLRVTDPHPLEDALAALSAADVEPYRGWSALAHLAEFCKYAEMLTRYHWADCDEALTLAGRGWLWWLTDEQIAPISALLGPLIDLEPGCNTVIE